MPRLPDPRLYRRDGRDGYIQFDGRIQPNIGYNTSVGTPESNGYTYPEQTGQQRGLRDEYSMSNRGVPTVVNNSTIVTPFERNDGTQYVGKLNCG